MFTFLEVEKELASSKKQAYLIHLKNVKIVLDKNDKSSLSFKKYKDIYGSLITYPSTTEEKLNSIHNRIVVIARDELSTSNGFYESTYKKFINDSKKPNSNDKLTTRQAIVKAFKEYGQDVKALEKMKKMRTATRKPTAKKKVVRKRVVAKKK
jgi:hypothetical protein